MRHTTFSEQEIESLRPAMKVGLLATVNEDGLPHITLLSSLQAASSTRLTFGQFIEGRGKCHVRNNPRVGFLVMTLQRDMWRGRALFTGTTQAGPELDEYNKVPMFRYNAYVGIHTVFSFDLVQHGGREHLPMGRIVTAALATKAASLFGRSRAILPRFFRRDWPAHERHGQPEVRGLGPPGRVPQDRACHPGAAVPGRRRRLFHSGVHG